MKKYSLLAAAAILGMLLASHPVLAQAPAEVSIPHKVGLIDMAHIFKNYNKFKDQTEALKKEAEAAEAQAQEMIKQGQTLQQQLTTYTAGSAEYNQIESQLIDLQGKLQSFKQKEQRAIVSRQAELYKKIYLEVQSLVAQYATHYKYTLVIRFSREDVSESADPQAIINNMNRQVVFFQPQDDITDQILKFMNQQYTSGAAR